MARNDHVLLSGLREAARPMTDDLAVSDDLLDTIGDARIVLLGEATHGTSEFYRVRAALSERLIRERGFQAIAVECDWPDALQVSREIARRGPFQSDPLGAYDRFPRWMWRNTVMRDFTRRLHAINANRARPVGFFGLDLYSLHASIDHVLEYLSARDPEAAALARQRYSCFDATRTSPQDYGAAAWRDIARSCESEVVDQLSALMHERARLVSEGPQAEDEFFYAAQNAVVVLRAEQYYRTMFSAGVSSWNLRDTHMADTLDALLAHLTQRGIAPKIVVWAHNSHLGDARATEAGDDGEVNLGQLMRERHPGEVFSLGFTTYDGTVTAANDWDEPPVLHRVRPALGGSYESLFHESGLARFLLDLRWIGEATGGLVERRLERMIGVVYRPGTERLSHYAMCSLPAQFDAVIHLDRTSALEPLDRAPAWRREEVPETFPSAM